MQAGGVTNGNLWSKFGEEENLRYKEKQLEEVGESLTPELTRANDNMKHTFNDIGGPESTLFDSSSVATTPTGAIDTGFPMAISAGEGFSDDTGSEDTRMNSVEQPLLDNLY